VADVLGKRIVAVIALLGFAAVLCSAAMVPPSAEASTLVPYCNNQKLAGTSEGGQSWCQGSVRELHYVYGWGDQHSVCVSATALAPACSSGPGAGVYDVYPEYEGKYYFPSYPFISNNAPGWNVVHGVSLDP
jgi:hypothetical protein